MNNQPYANNFKGVVDGYPYVPEYIQGHRRHGLYTPAWYIGVSMRMGRGEGRHDDLNVYLGKESLPAGRYELNLPDPEENYPSVSYVKNAGNGWIRRYRATAGWVEFKYNSDRTRVEAQFEASFPSTEVGFHASGTLESNIEDQDTKDGKVTEKDLRMLYDFKQCGE